MPVRRQEPRARGLYDVAKFLITPHEIYNRKRPRQFTNREHRRNFRLRRYVQGGTYRWTPTSRRNLPRPSHRLHQGTNTHSRRRHCESCSPRTLTPPYAAPCRSILKTMNPLTITLPRTDTFSRYARNFLAFRQSASRFTPQLPTWNPNPMRGHRVFVRAYCRVKDGTCPVDALCGVWSIRKHAK